MLDSMHYNRTIRNVMVLRSSEHVKLGLKSLCFDSSLSLIFADPALSLDVSTYRY
jgi:hypothetical protein